jgi:RNA polymerase sigma-70 factor (ECF subfamily)
MSIIEQSAYEAGLGAREVAAGDQLLVEALRRGDESAFAALIEQHHAVLLRLAMIYVPSRAVAEEVVQETWLGVLQGLERFEGRSSLKTWIFRILANRARTRGERESRCIPFASVAAPDAGDEPAVEAERFLPPGHEDAGWWVSYPRDWDAIPERRLLAQETRAHIQRAIEALPASQREVITLRDVEGWSSEEVCQALHISSGNERVLLHRARSKVRGALEVYLADA